MRRSALEPSVVTTVELGYPANQGDLDRPYRARLRIVHVIRKTSVIGAILTTAYLGGAVAYDMRKIGQPFDFPILMGCS